jgi:hypothetical protein
VRIKRSALPEQVIGESGFPMVYMGDNGDVDCFLHVKLVSLLADYKYLKPKSKG